MLFKHTVPPNRQDAYARFAIAWLAALIVLAAGCVRQSVVPFDELRSERLNKVIMCPICPGESIDQAQNDLAIQMRGIVRDQVNEGWTDQRIKQFWIERYGPSVILEPPREGFGLVAWLLPPVGLAFGALLLFLALRAMRRKPQATPAFSISEPMTAQKNAAYYRGRIEAALNPVSPVTDQAGEGQRGGSADG